MDVEKLIDCIRKRRPLWDRKSKLYHTRDLARKLWVEVASELKCSDEEVRKKWKNLQDTFRRECSKLSQKRSGDSGGCKDLSSWQFYPNMLFLRDQFKPRKTDGNIPYISETPVPASSEEVVDEQTSLPVDQVVQTQSQTEDTEAVQFREANSFETPQFRESTEIDADETSCSIPNEQNISSKRVRRNRAGTSTNENVLQQLFQLEQKKLEEYKRNSDQYIQDEDYHFAMSIIPTLRTLPSVRKMFVRTKIQQLLCDELTLTQNNYCSPIPTSSNPSTSWDSQHTSSQNCIIQGSSSEGSTPNYVQRLSASSKCISSSLPRETLTSPISPEVSPTRVNSSPINYPLTRQENCGEESNETEFQTLREFFNNYQQ